MLAELHVATITIGLLGGLSIFLFGMEQMTDALKAVAGGGMRTVLGRVTGNRVSAAITGALVTAVIQSSSVTSVLVVGFISAGLMTLAQSVGVIMGANIGTTITAQIIAFKVTQYALVLVTLGFGALFFGKRQAVRHVGAMVMGLGLVFLGMGLMSDATGPLRSHQPFIDLMARMDNPLLAMLVSALFTALVQSSSATTGIVIVLASQGFITLEAGIALALGANVGTCATALLASLGKPRAALRAATVHVLFNVVGALIWVGLIGLLAELVRDVSPSAPHLAGAARLGAETPRQIANAHTIFNVVNTLAFLPFTTQLARLVERIVPSKPAAVAERARPRFLDDVYLETPALAIDRVRLELGHLGAIVEAVVRGDPRDRAATDAAAADATVLYHTILDYERRIAQRELAVRDRQRLERLGAIGNHLQSIVDTVHVNLGALAREARERNLHVSEPTRAKFQSLQDEVADTIADAVAAVRDLDRAKAAAVIGCKGEIARHAEELAHHLGQRLSADEPDRLAVYRLESQVIEILKRLYYFAKRIAKTIAQNVDEEEAPQGGV